MTTNNDNGWRFETQFRARDKDGNLSDRLIGAYSKGNQVQLRYQNTGHVITTTTLHATANGSPREKVRYIVTKYNELLEGDPLEKQHDQGTPAVPGLRLADGKRGRADVLRLPGHEATDKHGTGQGVDGEARQSAEAPAAAGKEGTAPEGTA